MRHIWSYEQGDYDLLREKASTFDWTSLQSDDIDIYAINLNTGITSIASKFIPNKHVRIRPSDPHWQSSTLKRHIRKR